MRRILSIVVLLTLLVASPVAAQHPEGTVV
jgi:hypothetical protein